MTKDGILETDRKAYKDSRYRLNPKNMPKEMWEETILKLELLNLINENLTKFGSERPKEELFKELSLWLGALSLYSAFIAAKDGHNALMEIPAFYVTQQGGAQAFVRRPIAHSIISEMTKTRTLSDDEYFKVLFEYQNPSKSLAKDKTAEPALTDMKKSLEKAFGKDKIQQLENVFNKVLKEGKSNFQLLTKEESEDVLGKRRKSIV